MKESLSTNDKMQQRLYDRTVLSDDESCWMWLGAHTPRGYGIMYDPKRRPNRPYAHRVSYEVHIGPIPEGMNICHTCDNPSCVNPYHLFIGSQRDNIADASTKGRMRRGESSHFSKLVESEVRTIRKMVSEGTRFQVIADMFGISKPSVCLIGQRKVWAHVKDNDHE